MIKALIALRTESSQVCARATPRPLPERGGSGLVNLLAYESKAIMMRDQFNQG